MKQLSLLLFFIFFTSLPAWADCKPDKLTINTNGVNRNCSPLCPQLYFQNSLTIGTVAECKKNWDFYSKPGQEDYLMMALMLANGLGGQSIDLNKAKEYAVKSKLQDLVDKINAAIVNPTLKNKITYCDLNLASMGAQICSDATNQDFENKFQDNISDFSKTLPVAQQQALKAMVINLFDFISLDQDLRSTLGQFYGGTYETFAEFTSTKIMLSFYFNSYHNFIKNYPAAFKTNDSFTALDKQLNAAYSVLLAKIQQGGRFEIYPAVPTAQAQAQAKQRFIAAERAWIKYKQSFIHFGQLYYGKKYNKDEISETIGAYFTARRLEELKAETADYQSFVDSSKWE